jgi:hypothetical protein
MTKIYLIMKRFLITSLLLIVGLSSCSKNEETVPGIYPEDGLITLTRTLDLGTRAGVSTAASITAVFDVQTETVVSVSASQELLDVMHMTNIEFGDFIKDEMGPAYYFNDDIAAAETETFSGCMKGCVDNYQKGEGRGRCKFWCWMDLFERTLHEVVQILKPLL